MAEGGSNSMGMTRGEAGGNILFVRESKGRGGARGAENGNTFVGLDVTSLSKTT